MAKGRKQTKQAFSDYDLINQIVSGNTGNSEALNLRASNPIEGYQLTNTYNNYISGINEQAQANTINSGVYYDDMGNERSISELDNSGWFDSGVNDSGKLLRKSNDLILWDGTLASDREKQIAIENGVDPELADAMGKMAGKDLALRASNRGENLSSVLDMLMLGGVGRTELNARLVSDKLIPYFHPDKKEWVLKQATPDDIKAGAATVSAYGTPSQSDGFFTSFTRGMSNGLGKTLPMIYNAQEAVTDLSEASWNFATGKGFNSFDKGSTDKLAETYRKASEEGASPQSTESQDIFSVEGLASGLGQGVASLAQFGGIGSSASSLYTGFGAFTGKQGLKMLGANTINNLNNAGMFTAGMILNGGEAYESAKKAGLNEEDAATMFLAVGAINSLVEIGLGANKMQKWLIGDKGVEQVPKIILQETGGDLSKLASKKDNILNQIIDRVNRFTEIPVLGSAVEEGSEEFIQTLVGATGEFLYNKINPKNGTEGDGLFESKNLSEVFKEAFGAAAIGAILGGAGGIMSRNATAEKQDILPFIVNGQSDLVKSTLAEMYDDGLIDEGTYQAYDERVTQLSNTWNVNKNVFSKLADLEGVDENAIKSHVLSLIDTEFELKKDKQDFIKNISEINGDSELSDAVKTEKVKQVQNQILEIDNKLKNISDQITSFIPDANGNIGYFQKKESYEEVKDFIIKTANRIVPINEDEVASVFNFSNKSQELNSMLEKVANEGLTEENKDLIKEIIGLNDKDAFIDSVVAIRDDITKKKALAKEQAEKEQSIEFKAEESKVKNNKKKIKEKAAKVKKNQVAEEVVKEDDSDEFDFDFKPASLLNENGDVISSNSELDIDERIIEPTDSIDTLDDVVLDENDTEYNLTTNIEYWEERLDDLEGESRDLTIDFINDLKRKLKKLKNENSQVSIEINNQESSVSEEVDDKLTIEEEAVIVNINQEESYEENQILKQDGLIKNSKDIQSKKDPYKVIDATRKRAVGNTLIALNINYAENILGSTTKRADEYNIYDAYTDDGRLEINENFDSRLQDPKQFSKGTRLNVIIPTYQQIVARGIDSNNPYTESKYNTDKNDLSSLPIAFTDNTGKIVGFLPTANNIKKRVSPEYIETELIKNLALREQIFNNQDVNKTIDITDKSTGTPMFQRSNQSIYNALGDGSKLAGGVKIGIFKEGKLQVGVNNVFQDNIKLPNNTTHDMYFEEGVSYSIIPTAIEGEYFALPMDVNTIGDSGANTIIKMLELYKASTNFAGDADLLTERDNLSVEIDFSNFKELTNAIESLLYINNNNDNYILKIDNKKLILGMTSDMQFTWNEFRNQATKDKVRDILSKRYYAVRLADFNNSFNSYSVDDNNKLTITDNNNYFDYINNTKALVTNVQSEPIVDKTNERYFTAQSVIEIGNFSITPKQLVSNNNLNLDNIIIEDNFPNYDNNEANTFAIAIPVGNSNNLDIIGHISVNPETGHISSTLGSYGSVIEPEYRRKGIAFKAYIKVASKLAEKNITLKSDEGGKNNMNESSISLWNKLVDEGYAIDRGNYYEIINISASEEVSTTDTTVSTTEERKAPTKPKNRLGLKPKANKNNNRLNEDLVDFYNPFLTIDEEANFLMKKCSN